MQASELRRIHRLVQLARLRSASLSQEQCFVLGLIAARIRKLGLASTVSDYERHLLNEIESKVFDLEDGDLSELNL